MSHGWLHRLRSSGVGLAFLAGLLLAGLLHLPNFSSAQQPSAPGGLDAAHGGRRPARRRSPT